MALSDSLHEVEGVEQRVDEASGHLEERGKLRLEKVVVVLVLSRRKLEVLLHLEQVLLVAQALLFLGSELVEAVVVSVIVDQLVVALCASLANPLADLVQLLAGLHDLPVNELELRRKRVWRSASLNPSDNGPRSSSMRRW